MLLESHERAFFFLKSNEITKNIFETLSGAPTNFSNFYNHPLSNVIDTISGGPHNNFAYPGISED